MILAKIRVTAQAFPREPAQFGFLSTIIVSIRRPPVELWHMRCPHRTTKLRRDNPGEQWL